MAGKKIQTIFKFNDLYTLNLEFFGVGSFVQSFLVFTIIIM
jgi:hypothetical protein